MTTSQQPEALRLTEILEQYALSPLREVAAELRRQHARINELDAQLSAIGAGGVEPLRKAAATPIAWYVTGCSTMLDEHDAKAEAKRCGGSAKAVPLYTVPRGHAATQPAAQGMEQDAARWRMAALISRETMVHPDKRTIPEAVAAYMHAVHSGLDIQGAIDAALAAQAKQGERP